MNDKMLKESIHRYTVWIKHHRAEFEEARAERAERKAFFQSWTRERLLAMDEDGYLEFMSKLWALRMWGSKPHIVNYIIERNGMDTLRSELAELVWGSAPIADRWDRCRASVKDMGPAQMSEILCHIHPNECLLWNKRVYDGLVFLGVEDVPRHDYQQTGARYAKLCEVGQQICDALVQAGLKDADLLTVDYFIWQGLEGKDVHPFGKQSTQPAKEALDEAPTEQAEFIHNDIRDKVRDIGEWLGFHGETEKKVADGSKVDTVWEATIGNMGRVIYVFEVQTKGSLDSLILNLLKSLNSPAVQGVVAVSDEEQIEKIKRHAAAVKGLAEKLVYWDYEDVLQVHESLQQVNESINRLGLVPDGF